VTRAPRRGPTVPLGRRRSFVFAGLVVAAALVVALLSQDRTSDHRTTTRFKPASPSVSSTAPTSVATIPVAKPKNIYAGIGPNRLSPAVAHDLSRVYVPNGAANQVTVIDPTTGRVVDFFPAGRQPQHIVPSWDLRTLWVLDNYGNDVFPIDPRTGRPGQHLKVDDPYNLYFTPDGTSAIVVAEARQRLDFRDPHTMQLQSSLSVPGCAGINHADYSGDNRYMLVTCEFAGTVAKIDMVHRKLIGLLRLGTPMSAADSASATKMAPRNPGPKLSAPSMPQDVRAGPDGQHFYVADMAAGGVHIIDGNTMSVVGFIATGIGTHGITPSRDGKQLYIANRGSTSVNGTPHGPGSVSVIDTATNTVIHIWPVPHGGSPDMGNLSPDGTQLWLSGRFDAEIYAFDTATGTIVNRIKVGDGPHGLTVWPQPGAHSLGHTGNMR
jgi:YVTN family beta-propeller protein